MDRPIRVATRGSRLALAQTQWVVARLQELHPDRTFEIQVFKTLGDRTQQAGTPLAEVGGKGLFTKELEDALLDGRADLAVHSLKDLPTDLPPGLTLGAVPEREEALDAVVTRDGRPLADLPPQSRVGTSSLRRGAQIRRWRPDLVCIPIRGNVETRLRKLAEGQCDALIMAAAGLRRLDLADRITHLLTPDICLPAAGQGAIGIEVRAGDGAVDALLAGLHHAATATAVRAERAFLRRVTAAAHVDPAPGAAGAPGAAPPLSGSCQVPVAAHAQIQTGQVHLQGLVALPDGSATVAWAGEAPERQAEFLGVAVAEAVLARGGLELLLQVHLPQG